MKNYKIISIILVVCIIVSQLSVFISATATDQILQVNEIDENYFPDVVSTEEIEEHGYIERLKEEETDFYTLVFQNDDGTNTMRVYDYPVKYVDSNGNIKDISLSIEKKKDGSFVTADNQIITTFGKSVSEGITLSYDDIEVTMIPCEETTSNDTRAIAAMSEDGKTVTYVVDRKTSYEYALTYTGFKEDIVVNEYTGQTEYKFMLYTNGLAVYEEYGSYFLIDENGEIRAAIGDIIVFTADERNNTLGSMSYETVSENQAYRMTIHVDPEYLADKNTAYPIRIDPSIEISYSKNGSGAIEDVTISSLGGSSGSSGSLYVGLRETYGISRTLMRFPKLDLSVIPAVDCVVSATVELRDLLCESKSLDIYCNVFDGNSWTENTANWSNVSPDSIGSLLSKVTCSYDNGEKLPVAHRYSFDITTAVKGWKRGNFSQSKGIIFRISPIIEKESALNNRTFASYNRASYTPSLSVTYKTLTNAKEYIVAFKTGGNVLSNSSGTLVLNRYSASESSQIWVFEEVSSNVYKIRPKNDLNKCLTANVSSNTVTLSNAMTASSDQYWSWDYTVSDLFLKSASSNSNIKDKKLLISGGKFTLSDSSYSAAGRFDTSLYSPGISMYFDPIYLNVGESKMVLPTYNPTNTIGNSSYWSNFFPDPIDVRPETVYSVNSWGRVTAIGAGKAKLTIKNQITGLSCTANVCVSRLPYPDVQNKDRWCWAASAKKVGEHNGGSGVLYTGATRLNNEDGLHEVRGTRYYGQISSLDPTVDAGQRQIVIYTCGNDKDQTGSYDAIEKALQLASKKTMTTGTAGNGIDRISAVQIFTMNHVLEGGQWVVASMQRTDKEEAHAVVIQEYDADKERYTFWDPWIGNTLTFTRAELLNNNIKLAMNSSYYYSLVAYHYCN